MKRFRYRARDTAGKGVRGDVIALDPDEAAELLQGAGVYVTSLRPEGVRGRRALRSNPLVFMPSQERFVLLESWATLLRSGFAMQSAITQLRRIMRRPSVNRALLEVQRCIDRGATLTEALRTSRLFPPSWVSVVENAEKRGDYVGPLEMLLAHSREVWRIRREFISMLWMPSLITLLSLVWVCVYLEWMVPSVLAAVSQAGGSMPAAYALAAHSRWIIKISLGSLLALCLSAFAVLRSARTDRTMGLIQTWVPPRFPLLGPLVSRMHVIVVCSELRLQLEAGIPIVTAVRALSQSVPHPRIRRDLIEAHRALREGVPVPQALEGLSVIPPMGRALLEVGDSCGRLPEMLGLLVRETTLDLIEGVKRLTTVLRNLVLLGVGVMVGSLAVGAFVLLRRQFEVLAATAGESAVMRQLESNVLRPLGDFFELGLELFPRCFR